MVDGDLRKVLKMRGPARYRIRVQGRLDTSWSKRMGGLEISEAHTANGNVETVLEGMVLDQAALAGVFDTLYKLHLPILSAQRLSENG